MPGDGLIAVVTTSQTTGGPTTGLAAATWAPIVFWNNGGDSQQPATAVLWRPATADDPTGWAFARQGTTTTDQLLVHILAIDDIDLDAPFATTPVRADQTPAQRNPIPAPSIVVPDDVEQALLVTAHIAMSWYGSPGTNRWSVPAGMAKATDQGHSWAQMSTNVAAAVPGPTGARTSALSQNPNQQGRGVAFALRAAALPLSGPPPGRLLLAE